VHSAFAQVTVCVLVEVLTIDAISGAVGSVTSTTMISLPVTLASMAVGVTWNRSMPMSTSFVPSARSPSVIASFWKNAIGRVLSGTGSRGSEMS
jgi:hypothetical protein